MRGDIPFKVLNLLPDLDMCAFKCVQVEDKFGGLECLLWPVIWS